MVEEFENYSNRFQAEISTDVKNLARGFSLEINNSFVISNDSRPEVFN